MDSVIKRERGNLTATPALLLRLEGIALFGAALALYGRQEGSWLLFLLLFLLPDISMVGYLVNSQVGARLYNGVHTTVAPLLLAAIAFGLGQPLLLQLALIWLAHIGFDRTMGFGLKYGDQFSHTHLAEV